MGKCTHFSEKIIRDLTADEFNDLALRLFQRTLGCNPVYRSWVSALPGAFSQPANWQSIPCLPAGFFKTKTVYAAETEPQKVFLSSGTTGSERSRHAVADLDLYRKSLLAGFRYFFGDPADYFIAALTPTPEEQPDSSLVFMIDELMRHTEGVFLPLAPARQDLLLQLRKPGRRILLIGLAYALLDLSERVTEKDPSLMIVETGGMKGRRREMIREELHQRLMEGFGTGSVGSEYGMSEGLSQAWSAGSGIYRCPPWMKVLIRDPNDPFTLLPSGRTGGISIIDLANVFSCPFIATQDLGRLHPDGSFEVLGRFDYSELRGCSLMV